MALLKYNGTLLKYNNVLIKHDGSIPPVTDGYWIDEDGLSTPLPLNDPSITGTTFNRPTWVTDPVNVKIPEGVTIMAEGCLNPYPNPTPVNDASNISKLLTVDLPSTITTLEVYALQNCVYLDSLTIRASTPPSLSLGSSPAGNVGAMNVANMRIYVPSDYVNTYKSHPNWTAFSEIILPIT